MSIKYKKCFKCGNIKAIDLFHKHPQMKDGHINKCSSCTVNDMREWRKKQPEGERTRRYERELETGKRTRIAPQVYGKCPIKNKVSRARHVAKRRNRHSISTEFDDFVFSECVRLNIIREELTGIKWHVDHIIPINHKYVSGLHVANNLQCVPASWNMAKGNRSMSPYWPTSNMGY